MNGTDPIGRALGAFRTFSHAALVVVPLMHFESQLDGVGYTSFALDRVEENPRRALIRLRARGAVVLRHPDLNHPKDVDLSVEAMLDILEQYHGKQYPNGRRLATATGLGKVGYLIAEALAATGASFMRTDVVNPGPFCSELVAGFFELISAAHAQVRPLFKDRRSPNTVLPDHFRHSILEPVPGAACRATPAAVVSPEWKAHLDRTRPTLGPRAETRQFVAFMTSAVTVDRTLDKVMDMMSGGIARVNDDLLRALKVSSE
jgi:hypothetical protein